MTFDNLFLKYPKLANKIAQFKDFPTESAQQIAWAKQCGVLAQECFTLGQALEAQGSFDLAVQAYWQAQSVNHTNILKRAKLKKQSAVNTLTTAHDYQIEDKKFGYAAETYFYIGLRYHWGVGCKANDQQAVYYYQKAIALGHVYAQICLGIMYKNGFGVEQDYKEAARLYRLAIEKNYTDAQNNLGSLYDKGQGVEQDFVKAAHWYLLAAEQGHADAQYKLGLLHRRGQGVKQDIAKAAHWYLLAAEQGHTDAQYEFGIMCQGGVKGVAQSYAEELRWYRLSARQGNENAIQGLHGLYDIYADQLPLSVEDALACRRDIALGIVIFPRAYLKRYTAADPFAARYHAAHGLSLLFNSALKSLMAEAPDDFYLALQADKELNRAERLKYLRLLAERELTSLSPIHRSTLCYHLANQLYHNQAATFKNHSNCLQEVTDYLQQVEKTSEYYAVAQLLLVMVLSVENNPAHLSMLIAAQADSLFSKTDGTAVYWGRYLKQEPTAFEVLKGTVIAIKCVDTNNNAQLSEIIAKLKTRAEDLSQATQLSPTNKYLMLIKFIEEARNTLLQDYETKRHIISRFFHLPTQNHLVRSLNEILDNEAALLERLLEQQKDSSNLLLNPSNTFTNNIE